MSRALTGFALAAAGIGLILVIAWVALVALESLGGPDLRMPVKLLQSGAGLVLMGLVLRTLLQGRADKEQG